MTLPVIAALLLASDACTPAPPVGKVSTWLQPYPVQTLCWEVECNGVLGVAYNNNFKGQFSVANETEVVFGTEVMESRHLGVLSFEDNNNNNNFTLTISGTGCYRGACGEALFTWSCNAPVEVMPAPIFPEITASNALLCNHTETNLNSSDGTLSYQNYSADDTMCWEVPCDGTVVMSFTSSGLRWHEDYVNVFSGLGNGTEIRSFHNSGDMSNWTRTFTGPLLVQLATENEGINKGIEVDYECGPRRFAGCTAAGFEGNVSTTLSPAVGSEACWAFVCYGVLTVLTHSEFGGDFTLANATNTLYSANAGGYSSRTTLFARGEIGVTLRGTGGPGDVVSFSWSCKMPDAPFPLPTDAPKDMTPAPEDSSSSDGSSSFPVGAIVGIVVGGVVVVAVVAYLMMKKTESTSFSMSKEMVNEQESLVE